MRPTPSSHSFGRAADNRRWPFCREAPDLPARRRSLEPPPRRRTPTKAAARSRTVTRRRLRSGRAACCPGASDASATRRDRTTNSSRISRRTAGPRTACSPSWAAGERADPGVGRSGHASESGPGSSSMDPRRGSEAGPSDAILPPQPPPTCGAFAAAKPSSAPAPRPSAVSADAVWGHSGLLRLQQRLLPWLTPPPRRVAVPAAARRTSCGVFASVAPSHAAGVGALPRRPGHLPRASASQFLRVGCRDLRCPTDFVRSIRLGGAVLTRRRASGPPAAPAGPRPPVRLDVLPPSASDSEDLPLHQRTSDECSPRGPSCIGCRGAPAAPAGLVRRGGSVRVGG